MAAFGTTAAAAHKADREGGNVGSAVEAWLGVSYGPYLRNAATGLSWGNFCFQSKVAQLADGATTWVSCMHRDILAGRDAEITLGHLVGGCATTHTHTHTL